MSKILKKIRPKFLRDFEDMGTKFSGQDFGVVFFSSRLARSPKYFLAVTKNKHFFPMGFGL